MRFNTFTKNEINALLRNRDYDIAQLIAKHNNIIKCININSELKFYIWCEDVKLYIQNDPHNNNLKLALISILKGIILRVSTAAKLDDQITNQMLDTCATGAKIAKIMLVLYIKPDENFAESLDNHPYLFAIQDGKKIDIRTKMISTRTIHDYFSVQLNHTYLRGLYTRNNVFVQFIKTLFPDPLEYKFIQYLFGYLLSSTISENIFVIFSHPKGGGGKTLLMNTLHQIFPHYVVKLSRNCILHSSGNITSELCKLKNRRIAYIDEALDQKTPQPNVKQKSVVLQTLLDITGGGIRQDRDNYNKGIEVKMYKLNAKLILLGNDNSINNETHFALNRRIVYIPMQYYFRCKNHNDYSEADPFCLEANPTIKSTLETNLDHAFTWLIDSMHLYFGEQPNILESIPDRFTHAWNNTAPVNDKHSYWKLFVKKNIIQTRGKAETITKVKHAINNSITNSSMERYTIKNIENELKHQSTMKLIYSFKGTKGKHILNCKLKCNGSIMDNWSKQPFVYKIQ